MPVSEGTTPPIGRPAPIAGRFHLVGLLLILFGIAALGFFAQQQAAAPTGKAPTAQLAEHSQAIQIYLVALVMDWALFCYCYAGIRRNGGTLASLSGGRWKSAKDVLVDIAIAIPFMALWEGVAYAGHYLLDRFSPGTTAATVDSLLPKSLLEITLWILLCLTAGFWRTRRVASQSSSQHYLPRVDRCLGRLAQVHPISLSQRSPSAKDAISDTAFRKTNNALLHH